MTTRMPTGAARPGISPVTLVVFVIVALIAVMIAFVMYTGMKTREKDLAKLQAESKRLEGLKKAMGDETDGVRAFLESKRDAEAVKTFFNELDMKGTQPAPRPGSRVENDLTRPPRRPKPPRPVVTPRETISPGASRSRTSRPISSTRSSPQASPKRKISSPPTPRTSRTSSTASTRPATPGKPARRTSSTRPTR